ncbi:hypothetical protein D3C71_1519730 [compost metagenome]
MSSVSNNPLSYTDIAYKQAPVARNDKRLPNSEAVIARVGEPITGPSASSSCSHTSSCNKSRAFIERNGSRSSLSLSRKPPDKSAHSDAVK